MVELPRPFQLLMLEMEAERREAYVARIKADPIRHKATLQWADSIEPRWRYFEGGVDRRGVRRRFCWTTTRNAAGYFLTFTEVWNSKTQRGERKDIVASKRRETCKDRARARYQAYANRKSKRK